MQKLEGHDLDLVKDIIDSLANQGLQSDQRFADNFTRHRAMRGFGPARIEQELRQRGVDFLGDFDGCWIEQCIAAKIKRFGSKQAKDRLEHAKQVQFLRYRGYLAGHIDKAMDFSDCGDNNGQ